MILLVAFVVVLLFQIGGTAAVAVLVVAAVLEVGEIVVLRRWSRRLDKKLPPQDPRDELVGLTGKVVTACRPDGQVRVRGELWEATCAAGADTGTSVRVEAVDGLTIRVAPA